MLRFRRAKVSGIGSKAWTRRPELLTQTVNEDTANFFGISTLPKHANKHKTVPFLGGGAGRLARFHRRPARGELDTEVQRRLQERLSLEDTMGGIVTEKKAVQSSNKLRVVAGDSRPGRPLSGLRASGNSRHAPWCGRMRVKEARSSLSARLELFVILDSI